MGHYLGQCFLKEEKYIDKIITIAKQQKTKNDLTGCIEIGPWKWALSKQIVDIFEHKIFIEKDKSFQDILNEIVDTKSKIYRKDVLDSDIKVLLDNSWLSQKDILILGNLPYYITSPILRKFFVDENFNFDSGIFMVQKQVANKIKYDAKKKSFLWRLLNYKNKIYYKQTVPAWAFSPVPKVDSAIILIEKKDVQYDIKFNKLIVFLDTVTNYKRKMLRKIWKIVNKKDDTNSNDFIMYINWYKYNLPEKLSTKRLEKLNRNDIFEILK